MVYYSDECEKIITALKASPRKDKYIEAPNEYPPLFQVMFRDLDDSDFFADYISILRKKYPAAELKIGEGKTELCHMAARSGEPEVWVEACHKNNVVSDDYPKFFIEFNSAGAYEAALYMLKNAKHFQLNNSYIAKAFYYLIAELDYTFDEDDQPTELINEFLNNLEERVNLDIGQLTEIKDGEYNNLFFLCLGTKPFSVPLFINKWLDNKILEDRGSWKHFSNHYYDRHEKFHLPVMATIKNSGIEFDDSIMLTTLKEFDLTKLIKAYNNA